MFGSQSLDVAIGLVFTFLTVSLVCTAVNEMIATWTHSRAKMLERAIRSFLADNSDLFPGSRSTKLERIARLLLTDFLREKAPSNPARDSWAQALLNHPLISSTAQNDTNPSYVPGDTFASALVDLVVRRSQVPDAADKLAAARSASPADFSTLRQLVAGVDNEHLRKLLIPLLDKIKAQPAAGSAFKAFTDEIESWYDNAMDRVSGWYKRKTQNVLLVIAILVAFVGNIDAIAIWQSLGDVKTRASVITAAEVALKNAPAPADPNKDLRATLHDLQNQIANAGRLGIPIGWRWDSGFSHEHRADNLYDALTTRLFGTKLIGLLLTAIAASLGAPFWFDILKYIMSVRAAGKAPEEAPIPPKEVPKPEEPVKPSSPAALPLRPGGDTTGVRDLLAQAAALNPSTRRPAFPQGTIIVR